MRERFNKEMDNIMPNRNLERDTITKMKAALNKRKDNRWKIVPVTAFALVILLAIGFLWGNFGKNGQPSIHIAHGENLMENIEGQNVDLINKFPEEFLDKTREFSIEMFKKLSRDENAVYSPTPLYFALGLVANGGEGETKEEILSLLKTEKIKEDDLNLYYKSFMANLSSKSQGLEVDIVNSIWYDEDFEVYKDYLEKNKTFYDADAYRLDFKSPAAPDTINNWVKRVSRDRIDKMLEEIDKDVVMYLFSSIYFDGKWEEEFKGADTKFREFYLGNGETIDSDFMHREGSMLNIINNNEKGVLLPYKGGKYGFLALLPDENIDINDYILAFTKDSLVSKIESMNDDYIYLSLPKFEVEFGKKLNDDLKELGINKMFDRYGAELFKMGKSDDNLYVSEVAQKTYLRVDEEGTEAASIVKVEIKRESAMMGEYIDFNRPFVYAIMDLENNLPIFMGVMNDPS